MEVTHLTGAVGALFLFVVLNVHKAFSVFKHMCFVDTMLFKHMFC